MYRLGYFFCMRDLSKYRDEYISNMGFEATLVKYRRRLVIEQLCKFKVKNVLEVGCGISSLAEEFQSFDEFTVVDPIEKFISMAKENYESFANLKKINFTVMSLQEFAIQNRKKFDFIVVSSLIHELEDKTFFFKSIKKLCNPETIIHFNVPNALSLHNLIAVKMGLIKNPFELSFTAKGFQRKSTYSLSTLEDEVVNNGFKVVDKGSYLLKPFANFQMQFLKNNADVFSSEVFDALYDVMTELPSMGAEIYVNARISHD